jgi:hypothetical protein
MKAGINVKNHYKAIRSLVRQVVRGRYLLDDPGQHFPHTFACRSMLKAAADRANFKDWLAAVEAGSV